MAWRCSGHKSTCFGPLKTTAPSEGRAHMTRPPASPAQETRPGVRGPCMTPARVLTIAPTSDASGRRTVTLQRRQPQMGPEARSGRADSHNHWRRPRHQHCCRLPKRLARSGSRARSPDGGRGTRKLPFISIVFTIKLLSRMPLRPAPAPARAAFHPKVPSGLTGRAPAWGP